MHIRPTVRVRPVAAGPSDQQDQRVGGDRPNFDALLHSGTVCGGVGCPVCAAPTFTPRTCEALYLAFQNLADDVYDDLERFGDGPLDPDQAAVLDLLPRFTWSCDGHWRRRRVARAFDDLGADMAAGVLPRARCPAEEVAVVLAVRWAEGLVGDDPEILGLEDVPAMPSDFDWSSVLEELLLDLDVEFLLDAAFDGVEDPGGDFNLAIRMGDYRAERWFDFRDDVLPRDPERGFRRPVELAEPGFRVKR